MIDLYTVPLGATARDFFSAEAENKYSYDEALLGASKQIACESCPPVRQGAGS